MNRYGTRAMRHWARWMPHLYAVISHPDSFFTTLGEIVARQVDELTDTLAGDDRPGEGYLARVCRLTMARKMAEGIILHQLVLPNPEPVVGDDPMAED